MPCHRGCRRRHRRAGPGQLADGIGAIRARGIEECGALLLVHCVDGCTMREQQREQLGIREFCRLHERGDSEAVGAAHVAPVVDQVLRRRQRIRRHRMRQHRRAEGIAERGDAVTERMQTGDIAVARPKIASSVRSVASLARPLRTGASRLRAHRRLGRGGRVIPRVRRRSSWRASASSRSASTPAST